MYFIFYQYHHDLTKTQQIVLWKTDEKPNWFDSDEPDEASSFTYYQHISTWFQRPCLPFSHVMPLNDDKFELGHLDDKRELASSDMV